jgi:hypothetical protein
MGSVALRTAMRRGSGLDSHHVELGTELIVRHSTAPPGGGADERPGVGDPPVGTWNQSWCELESSAVTRVAW